MGTRRKLEDHTAEELKELNYLDLCHLRRNAYARHVAEMEVPPEVQQWVATMTKRHGDKVRVWFNEMGWLEALMVVRYGEDVTQWPPEFSEDDVRRLTRWDKQLPQGIVYLDTE